MPGQVKPAAHMRKELSKMPREADSSAVSSRVRWSFGENFASRGEISNIKHVGYLRFRLARRNSHQNFTAHERKRLSYLPREAFCSALSSRVRRALPTSAKWMFSVTLAYWFELSLLKTNTQNNTEGTKSHVFLHFTNRLLHLRR